MALPTDAEVTARFIFVGVMLTCITEKKNYEVGILKCPEHIVRIRITERLLGQDTMVGTLIWPNGHDLVFKVVYPETEGVEPYPPTGEDTDFDFVVDLEGPKLHQGKLKNINTEELKGRRLGVTDGRLYSQELLPSEYKLATWENPGDRGVEVTPEGETFGQLALKVGLNVKCLKDGGIAVIDVDTGRRIKWMPRLDDVTYVIEVDNDCFKPNQNDDIEPEGPVVAAAEQPLVIPELNEFPPTPAPEPAPATPTPPMPIDNSLVRTETDFRLYYDVITKEDKKFDFIEVPSSRHGPEPSPGACVNGHLSVTKTLGLAWPQD